MHQEQVISGLQSSKSSPTRSLAMDSSAVAELDALKQENASLRGQVERQNASILNQSEAINRLETSTSTILFCDEEEMKLLKQDLVRARNDKVQLQKLLRSSQKELEDLQQTNADVNSRLQFMERQMSHSSRLLRYADHAELHYCAVLYHRACPLTSTLLGNERKNY
jgi:predicted  nucleic acid-binding Zn-ribbon protein